MSYLNTEFVSRVYAIRKHKHNHAKILARFEDPAYQHVLAGLYVISGDNDLDAVIENVRYEQEVDPDVTILYVNSKSVLKIGEKKMYDFSYGNKSRNRNMETIENIKRGVKELVDVKELAESK